MQVIEWDSAIFEVINVEWSNSFFDFLLPILRNAYTWVPMYIFIVAFSFMNFGKKAYWFVLFLVLTVSTADLISNYGFKKNFQRLRPCRTENLDVIERVRCGSGYSFTSNHAANHFAMATFLIFTLGQIKPKIKPWLWLWAGSIAFAQVYVGVHFPLDVICGSILGFLVGVFWVYLFEKYYGYVLKERIQVA